jgi:hypothetical protein
MKRFSEREGLKKVRTEIQIKSMDEALRNRLWNVLDFYYWKGMIHYSDEIEEDDKAYFTKLWHYYFKKPVDDLHFEWDYDLSTVKEYFFKCEWYEVYDFMEFTANNYPDEEKNKYFMKTCNDNLEGELSAYRFVGGRITQITSEEEISEIEEVLETPLKPVKTHIENSLKLLSDRKSPDYRNSIKESISAVEAICRLITKKDKATLGQALKEVETKVGLHGALKKAFSNLYGYTSSADGIRHSLLDEPKLSFEDAKFMLVSCSAFINYLIPKVEKAKIKL